jgi:hypothetical protein
VAAAVAGTDTIPQPDGIIFGTLFDSRAADGDDRVVFARIEGVDHPVAVYRMGDLPAAGNLYSLHIPYRLHDDGHSPTPDSPSSGTKAYLFVANNSGPEVFVGDVLVPKSGEAVRFDVVVPADAGANSPLTQGRGALCGVFGFIPAALMMLGLISMRTISRRSRRS